MDRHYAMKLLREAMKEPQRLLERKKFWKVALYEHYLRRCDDLLFHTPTRGLAFTRHAPAYATKVAAANPSASGADLLLLAHAHLGGAYRWVDDHDQAEKAFAQARSYESRASRRAVAELYRRLAYLRLVQKRPEAFTLIDEAIAIHKHGNLVHRHELGQCLLCRGHAYYAFGQPGKSLEDLTAALNHISLRSDPKSYYAALHNLATWAADHGSEQELRTALDNLEPAQTLLNSYHHRHFAKTKLRWLTAVIEARLGHGGQAELTFLDVRAALQRLELPYETAMLEIDLAMLYLRQGRLTALRETAERAAATFRRIGIEAEAEAALALLRRAEGHVQGEAALQRIRTNLARFTTALPASQGPRV